MSDTPNSPADARAEALAQIQRLIDEGPASGPARPFDMNAFIARMKAGEADHPR